MTIQEAVFYLVDSNFSVVNDENRKLLMFNGNKFEVKEDFERESASRIFVSENAAFKYFLK